MSKPDVGVADLCLPPLDPFHVQEKPRGHEERLGVEVSKLEITPNSVLVLKLGEDHYGTADACERLLKYVRSQLSVKVPVFVISETDEMYLLDKNLLKSLLEGVA